MACKRFRTSTARVYLQSEIVVGIVVIPGSTCLKRLGNHLLAVRIGLNFLLRRQQCMMQVCSLRMRLHSATRIRVTRVRDLSIATVPSSTILLQSLLNGRRKRTSRTRSAATTSAPSPLSLLCLKKSDYRLVPRVIDLTRISQNLQLHNTTAISVNMSFKSLDNLISKQFVQNVQLN